MQDGQPSEMLETSLPREVSENHAGASTGRKQFAKAVLAIAALLLLMMAPLGWTDNEINYFDLAWRLMRPSEFGQYYAEFDQSNARFLSFALIGGLIEVFGQDGALVAARLLLAGTYALSIAYLLRSFGMTWQEGLFGLAVFILVGQNYFAGEALFSTAEPKMFAYAAVLAAIGLAWNARVIWAGILVGLATYFHFLVGGFWALAILALIGLKQGNWKIAWRYIGTYVPITLPIAYILFSERVLLPAPDISGFDLSLDQIYSVLRAPHHTAPFSSDQQMRMWLPGSVLLVIVTVLMVPLSRRLEGDKRTLVRWILLLNIYLMLCFVVAFIDRPTYFFGPFYIFRPNSLALFLTLMLGANLLRGVKIGKEIGILRICAPVAVILVALHRSAIAVTALFVLHQFPLERSIDPSQMELIKWLRQTDSQSTVLIENAPEADWIPRWLAMERLIHRPTFVNFKFVPTERNDLARWYRLIRWKEAVFKGECERISEQPVDYLVILRPATMKTMLACGSLAWTNDTYSVIKVR